MMVTLVPPDSGPRLGDRPVTEGVYKNRERERLRETVRALKQQREKGQTKRQTKTVGVFNFGEPVETFMYYQRSPCKLQLFILPGRWRWSAAPVERREDKTRSS